MSPLEVVLLITGILGVVALVTVVISLLVQRRSKTVGAELDRDLGTEAAVGGPEPALYRSGTGRFSKVKGNCVLALTEERLVVRMLIGKDFEIDVNTITGVREAKWFNGGYGGRIHLIVTTQDGEAGFFVRDNETWKAAISAASPHL